MVLWTDAEGFRLPTPKTILWIGLVIILIIFALDLTPRVGPVSGGQRSDAIIHDRLADTTEGLLLERGIVVGFSGERRRRITTMRDDFWVRRRIAELVTAYKKWGAAGRVGTDPITASMERIVDEDDPSGCLWLRGTIPCP